MSEDEDKRVLEEGRSAGSYLHSVIDLASVRVAKGWRSPKSKKCEHRHLVYSPSDRIIECDDCKSQVDPFDAFCVLTLHFDKMLADVRRKQHSATEAMQSTLHRRAAKELERIWSKMAPCCPHCRRGLLPEDFERGVAAVSRDIEIARRKRDAATSSAAPLPPEQGDGNG